MEGKRAHQCLQCAKTHVAGNDAKSDEASSGGTATAAHALAFPSPEQVALVIILQLLLVLIVINRRGELP